MGVKKREKGKDVPRVCGNCFFWEKHEPEPGGKPVDSGSCNRFPPTVILVEEGGTCVWPSTSPINYCGEFKLRVDA